MTYVDEKYMRLYENADGTWMWIQYLPNRIKTTTMIFRERVSK